MSCLLLWRGLTLRTGGLSSSQRTHTNYNRANSNVIGHIARPQHNFGTLERSLWRMTRVAGGSNYQTSWVSPCASYATSASKSVRTLKSRRSDVDAKKRSTKKKEDKGGWLNITRPDEEELVERVRKAEALRASSKYDLVKSVGSEAYDPKKLALSEWELPEPVDTRGLLDESKEADWRGATGINSRREAWGEEGQIGSRGWEDSVGHENFDEGTLGEGDHANEWSSDGVSKSIRSELQHQEPARGSKKKKRMIEFESPLKGDFTDLSAPYSAPTLGDATSLSEIPEALPALRGTLEAEKVGLTNLSSSARRGERSGLMSAEEAAGEHGLSSIDPMTRIGVPKPVGGLGLTETSRRILASGSKDVVGDYMKLQDMSEKDLDEAKHSMELPLGTMEATALAARRVADILTMPIHGPSPIYKGRDPHLFTDDEERYFDKYPRTPKNYNKFIWSLCKVGKFDKARLALEAMKHHGVRRDVGIYTSLMQGCIPLKDPREAIRVFVEMRKDGIAPDEWVFDSLMEVFVESGELDGAFALYDELKPNGLKPTNIIFTTLVKGCIRDDDLDRAWKVFEHMRVWHCEPDEVMMNLMIHACARRSETERAFRLYQDMKTLGLRPTHVTFNTLLHACVRRRDYYEQAFDLLRTMKVEGYIPDHRTFDMLLAVAAKGGDVQTAELLFDEASSAGAPPREQTFAYMIESYAMAHRVASEQHNRKRYVAKAEKLFERMVSTGIRPTNLSLNMILNLYTWNSLISKAVEWKKAMREIYHIKPDVYAYTSMIEMYGRTRQMDLALDQFNLMKAEGLEPSLATYGVLMEGCTRSHLVSTGMKLLREMKAKNIDIKPETTFIINFRRGLIKTPDMIREIDQITGKAYRFVMPWRRKGQIRKITYHRELTKEEAKKTSLYG